MFKWWSGRDLMVEAAFVAARLDQTNRWCLERMTQLNRDILNGRGSAESFEAELGVAVVNRLPVPEDFSSGQAQRMLVLLGLAGASLGRHCQEAHPQLRITPEKAFAGLAVGKRRIPFRSYFSRLALRTGSGHCPRDSYSSLVRWNVPTAAVLWGGQVLSRLPSVFEDGRVRTYTGSADETRFFGLLKASEALEHAVNQELMPLSTGALGLKDPQALRPIARAVILLNTLRQLNRDFAERPATEGLDVGYFMDVFRQFAVHWELGDIPPSGALDAEALIRDLLLGIDSPTYADHVRRVSPGLLDIERTTLTQLAARASLPEAALQLAHVRQGALDRASPDDLRRLVVRHPVLAALYRLLTAHARVAGVHLMLSKRFLFDPQHERDRAGLGDPGVVSNRTGTTGMDEARLMGLTQARRHHLLAALRVLPAPALQALATPIGFQEEFQSVGGVQVQFAGTAMDPYDLGLRVPGQRRVPESRGQLSLPEPNRSLRTGLGPV